MGETNSSINNTLRLTLKNLNTSTNSIITSNDRVIDAFGKLQAQISNISSSGSSVSISNGNNFTIYNTTDQVTNYERFRGFWNSNIFYLSNQSNGSGQRRPIFLNVNTAGLVVNDTASVGGGIRVISNPQTANTSIFGVLGVLNGSNTVQDGATIAPYFNQSGTATGNALKVSPFISTVGAGVNLLNLGTNTAADNTGTHTPRFVVASNGNVGFGTESPTHTITLPSGASWVSYNTADQNINYERVRGGWSSDSYFLSSEKNGDGLNRSIRFSANGAEFGIGGTNTSVFLNTMLSSASNSMGIYTTLLSSSPIQNTLVIAPTVNQSGTAGYRGVFVSPFEQSTGSGSKLLLDLGTNSAANGSGTHTSKISVNSTGNLSIAGNILPMNDATTRVGSSTLLLERIYSYNLFLSQIRSNNVGGIDLSSSTGMPLGKIFDNGNWFIGSSPVDAGYKLDINGTARVSDVLSLATGNTKGLMFSGTKIVEAVSAGSYTQILVQPRSGNKDGVLQVAPSGTFTDSALELYNSSSFGTARNVIKNTNGLFQILRNDVTQMQIFTSGNIHFQNGGVYTDVPSATFAINSTNQGVLLPRMTTTQRDAISSPAEGLIIYNTTTKKLNIFTTIWEQITSA